MSIKSTIQTLKVFISYCHVKPDEDLALAIEKALKQDGLEVFIDHKIQVGTEWATEIEKKLSESDYFVVLLSAKSIKSDMVRQEINMAHKLKKESNLIILPVRVNYDGGLGYDLSSYLEPITCLNWQPNQSYKEISDDLRKAIRNTNDSHQQQEALTPIQSSTEKTKSHTTHQHHLPDQPDNKFIEFIKGQIANELNSSDLTLFRDVLKQELDKSLERLKQPGITDNQVHLIVDGLITVLKTGKTDVPIITSVLTNAAMHCFDKRGKHYQASLTKHILIKEAIEQMLGWLVLASVDDDYAQDLSSVPDYSGVYFELPVVTLAGIEVIVSRRYQHQAKLKSEGSNMIGQNHLFVSSSQFTWEPSETVNMLKRMLWNQVFPLEKKEDYLNKKDTDKLNAELEIRRADEWKLEHHLIAIECEKIIPDTQQEEVYRQLLQELNQLTLVQFGVSDSKQVFCVPEYHLMSAINRFLDKINNILES